MAHILQVSRSPLVQDFHYALGQSRMLNSISQMYAPKSIISPLRSAVFQLPWLNTLSSVKIPISFSSCGVPYFPFILDLEISGWVSLVINHRNPSVGLERKWGKSWQTLLMNSWERLPKGLLGDNVCLGSGECYFLTTRSPLWVLRVQKYLGFR